MGQAKIIRLVNEGQMFPHSPRVPNEEITKVYYKVLGPGLRSFEASLIRSMGGVIPML